MAPLLLAALIGAGASLASGFIGASASDRAASAQEQASRESLGLQTRIYEESKAAGQPWLKAGEMALALYMGEHGYGPYANSTSNFKTTPGYDFAVKEGERGVVNNLAALGMKNSGAALKTLTNYRMGVANQEHGNYLNRLAALAGIGQTQANSNASLGANFAANAGQTMQDAGTARASGYVGGANSWMNALGNFGNNMTTALGRYNQNWQYV